MPWLFTDRAGLSLATKEKEAAGPVVFLTSFLEAMGFTVVGKKQKADAELTLAYGTLFEWRREKSFPALTRRLSKVEFMGDFWIACRGAKSVEKMYRAAIAGTDQVYGAEALPEREVQEAYKASGFEPGVVTVFRELCGPARVEAALKKMGRIDLL